MADPPSRRTLRAYLFTATQRWVEPTYTQKLPPPVIGKWIRRKWVSQSYHDWVRSNEVQCFVLFGALNYRNINTLRVARFLGAHSPE